MKTDAQLLHAARGDAGAFRELYDRYAKAMLEFHRRRASDLDTAYDLTAETFAQAWLSRARFLDEADGSAGPWLFGIARNVGAAAVRKGALETRARVRLGMLEGVDRPAAGEAAAETDWGDELEHAFKELPSSQREAIQLRVVEDKDYGQVSRTLGTTPEAARVRVHRGLQTLRKTATHQPETTP